MSGFANLKGAFRSALWYNITEKFHLETACWCLADVDVHKDYGSR
jgi:hypothetical protein